MPKRTLLLIVVLIIATVGLISLSLYTNKPKPKPVAEKQTPGPETKLILSDPRPAGDSANPELMAVDVNMETGSNRVTGIELELKYDPAAITNVDITKGPFADSMLDLVPKKINTTEGKIFYTIITPPSRDKAPVNGKGTVATITFTESSNFGTTSINFIPGKTNVIAEGILQSVLKSTLSTTFKSKSTGTSASQAAQTKPVGE